MCIVSTPVTVPSAPRLMEYVLRPADGERENQGLATDGSARSACITQKWTAAALQPLPGTTLKEAGRQRESLAVGRTLGGTHVCIFFLEKCTDVWLFTDSWAVVSGLSGQGLGKSMTGKLGRKTSGEENV